MQKIKNIIGFYTVCNRLKDVIRTGWKTWNVQRDRLESVAEHVYSTQMLAIAMYSEFQYDIDIKKVVFMIALHEVGEAAIGDITQFQMSKEEKTKREHMAIHAIFAELSMGKELENLLLEFDERQTKEALFAFMCDKLEADLQCKLYGQDGCVDLTNQPKNEALKDKLVQDLLSTGKSWHEMWLTFDKNKYPFDENFMAVLDYVMSNDIKTPDSFNELFI